MNPGEGYLFLSSVYKTPSTVTVLHRLKQIFVPYSVAYSRTTNNEAAVVDTATRYVLDGLGIKSRSRDPRSLLYNEYQVFSGVKQPEHGADHLLPSSIEVANELELYLCVAAVRA